ncbi:MAG: hypothetical protein FWD57_14230 [Polyangiaceae bacterium]|nr:hypothetical protein [Polyangiaceae bacterium]
MMTKSIRHKLGSSPTNPPSNLPLNLPIVGKLSLESRLRAAVGIPAYMRRKRRIEDIEDAMRDALEQLYEQSLIDNRGNEAIARSEVVETAQGMDLSALNDLIERHNKYYPIEANLPTDVQSGRIMAGGKPWEPIPAVTWRDFCEFSDS